MVSEADQYAFLIGLKDPLLRPAVEWVIKASHVVVMLGWWIAGTFVDSLLTQRIEFELMEHLERLFFLLIFQVLAIVKPSQIDFFFLCVRSIW